MKSNTRRFMTIVGIGLGLMMPLNMAFANSPNLEELTAEWWQWALSIPTSINPLLDTTGGNCMVGQRGSTWFLAGSFGSGSATRTCAVPEGTVLFFPVINAVNINSPNVCGQGPRNIPVSDLRASSAATVNGATNLSVKVDGRSVANLQRVRSQVFEVALPGDNVFNPLCGGPGSVPAGIYSPAVDDGFYVMLAPLNGRTHKLQFHAENPSQPVEDVTYNLTVVPVLLH
jgi:hypothetical protein